MCLQKSLNRRTIPVFVLACLLVLFFILFGLFIPVRLLITDMPSPWYADMHLDCSNTQVMTQSLFGLKLQAHDVYGRQTPNGDIKVWSKELSYETKKEIITPVKTKITYDGDGVYVGQSIDASKVHVKAIYESGEKRDVSWFQVSNDVVPLSSDVEIPVKTAYTTTSVKLKTIPLKKIKASYVADCNMGDLFDSNKVTVTLVYDDDTTYDLSDFVVPDAPKYISDNTSVTIATDYGSTVLHIVPKNAQKLHASYTKNVYVGDTLDISNVKMTIGTDNKPLSDIRMEDVGVIKTKSEVLVSSKYGNAVLKVNPIGVKSCKGFVDGELVENITPNITKITVIFEDDTMIDLSPSDYEITNLSNGIDAGLATVWFRYHSLYLSFKLSVIPQEIVDLRKTDENIPQDAVKYNLSDSQIETIAILCQRLASDDLTLVAAEASLLANRFELYGFDNKNIVDYMISSGYWGADVSNYLQDHDVNEMVSYVIRDVLVNGHRVLPVYIDERQAMDSVDSFHIGDEISKDDGTVYFFYSVPSMKTSVVYGFTRDAYNAYHDDNLLIENDMYNDATPEDDNDSNQKAKDKTKYKTKEEISKSPDVEIIDVP